MDHVESTYWHLSFNDTAFMSGHRSKARASVERYGVSALGYGQLLFNVITDAIEFLNMKKKPIKSP